LLNVDTLRAVQTSGPTTTSTCLLRAGPIFHIWQIRRYIEQIKTRKNKEQLRLKQVS